jgi:hypothetical protein
VEGDRAEPAARAQQLPGQRQRGVELRQLVVDRDADRLEAALGRMPAGEARRRRDGGRDRVDELEGGVQRPAAQDLRGDAVGVALLAVLAQHPRDAPPVPLVEQGGRGQRLRRVHAHVQRRVVGV